MELSTSKIWTYLKSGRQNPICSTKNSVPLLMEMATCFASPRASPVRGLLALFLLGGRKVWEPGRGRLWVQSYPYIQTSPFSRVFARWPEGAGSVGAGLGYKVIPFPDLSFLACFCSVAGKCGKPGRGGLWVQSYLFPGLPHLSVIAQNTGKGGVWKGVTLWNSLPTCLKPGHRGKVCSWSSRLHVLASLSDANSVKKNSFWFAAIRIFWIWYRNPFCYVPSRLTYKSAGHRQSKRR